MTIMSLLFATLTAQAQTGSLQGRVCLEAINEDNPQIADFEASSMFLSFDEKKSNSNLEVYKIRVVNTHKRGVPMLSSPFEISFHLDSEKHLSVPCTDYSTKMENGDTYFQIR